MPDKSAATGGGGTTNTRGSEKQQEGYTPVERGGYTPTNKAPALPSPPPGGSGISPAPQEPRK
jgi:hypothetical protein